MPQMISWLFTNTVVFNLGVPATGVSVLVSADPLQEPSTITKLSTGISVCILGSIKWNKNGWQNSVYKYTDSFPQQKSSVIFNGALIIISESD